MSPLTHSKGLAARMGGWSANHWKTAVIGWFAFVTLSVFVGMQVGIRQIDQNDANVGESRTADRIIDKAGFTLDAEGESIEEQEEMVLLQSKTLTVTDTRFRAAIADVEQTLRTFPKVRKLQSPLDAGHADLVSKDGHSALIQFSPKGTYEEVVLYIDTIGDAVEKVGARHAGLTVDSLGVSTDKALDAEIQGGLGKAGLISIPLTIIILLFVLGSLVGALIPLLLGITSVLATTGLLALSSQGIAAAEEIMEVVLLIGLAVGVDYSLFYMKREREERAAGRRERAALEAASATSGRAVLVSGITVLIAMAGMFLSGDKTFMSFSVGTMIVVAVAMLASLTVLPAVLGKLGDRVEKGRIPFTSAAGALSATAASGARSSSACSGTRSSRLSPPAPCWWRWRCRPSAAHRADWDRGHHEPRGRAVRAAIEAFPGTPDPAVVAIKADDVKAPRSRTRSPI